MTTEQKAKAYDEALERARQIKNGENGWGYYDLTEITPALENIFPELRESEDERIINQLITLVNSTGEVLLIPTNKEELVAWLNKCKESLHISESCKENADSFTDEDERMRELVIDRVRSAAQMTDGLRELLLTYLEKQKEQKPKNILTDKDTIQTAYCKGLTDVIEDPEAYGLCKPAEWSEEDERMRNQLIYDVEQHKEKCLISAKQQKATKALYDGIEKCYDEKIAWLKSLRTRPSWKPSEEQMNAFSRFITYCITQVHTGCYKQVGDIQLVEQVYKQLKKL